MAGFITAEGIVVAAGSDTYDYVNDQRRLAGSIRSVSPVANPAAANTIISAMATDGRPVSDTNPLVTWDASTHTVTTYNGGSQSYGVMDYAALYKSTTSMVTGNFTTLTFTTLAEDSNGLTTAVPTSKITIKKPGRYVVTFGIGAGSWPACRIAVKLMKNGADTQFGGQLIWTGGGAEAGAKGVAVMTLVAGDFLEISGFQDTGSNRSDTALGSYSAPHLQVQQVTAG